ncbi:hypothetical protein AGABI1DRAFT_109876 [Agaricus bisporus var. burnettii JB137-S8]|uniref:Uncharacterized protein n=1 Tax=Agaricus bisporus var. burnettii (strain JB137-S8 / ATCC MYA-4627 / FGSC 10392) TaxID=597362 RepID=K5WVE5_AGABU|nr:uncharacterized protein AGABI1DRAFT_109876 [Agaricus bisporus var. burnettii JB137-S8]EKM74748.1 hypothetical protein AGABI1DRAFT_109876 [Agaricus bisporus var. burnettii JB137-S8]
MEAELIVKVELEEDFGPNVLKETRRSSTQRMALGTARRVEDLEGVVEALMTSCGGACAKESQDDDSEVWLWLPVKETPGVKDVLHVFMLVDWIGDFDERIGKTTRLMKEREDECLCL